MQLSDIWENLNLLQLFSDQYSSFSKKSQLGRLAEDEDKFQITNYLCPDLERLNLMYFYCLNKTNSCTTFGNFDYFQFLLVSAFLPTEIPECPNHQQFSKNCNIDLKTAVIQYPMLCAKATSGSNQC